MIKKGSALWQGSIKEGGGTISTLLILDNNFTDVVANYFQTFIFDSSWSNLSSVALNGIGATCCGQPPGNYFAIDNIVVDVAPTAVPEPGTLSLLGLASAYMVGRRRRNRR